MLSSGVPMLNMGDEVSRTQNGSNNAYSLPLNDSQVGDAAFNGGWALPWKLNAEQQDILNTVKALAEIRDTYLADVASEFFTGAVDKGTNRKDIAWFSLGGNEMSDDHWRDEEKRSITVFIEADPSKALLLMLNSSKEETSFALPDASWGETFRCIFDASHRMETYEPVIAAPSAKIQVPAHSVLVWLVSGRVSHGRTTS
jgi:glycogen operon protein